MSAPLSNIVTQRSGEHAKFAFLNCVKLMSKLCFVSNKIDTSIFSDVRHIFLDLTCRQNVHFGIKTLAIAE